MVVADVDEGAAGKVVVGLGDRADAVRCDVREEAEVDALVDGALERHGRLDIAVANAGVSGPIGPLAETSTEGWKSVMDVNVDGTFRTLRRAGAVMAARGDGGALISTASIMGLRPAPLCGAYSATKAAVISMTRSFALELRPAGVRANAICPGFIDTALLCDRDIDLGEELGIPDLDAVVSRVQGRFGQPADITGLALFLASDRASFLTGGAYTVDGGLSENLL